MRLWNMNKQRFKNPNNLLVRNNISLTTGIMVKRIIILIAMILPLISYSQKHSNELKDNIQLDIGLIKDSISFGDSLVMQIIFKNVSNNNLQICTPSNLFIVEELETPFAHGFEVLILNRGMNGVIKDLMPNEEITLKYKIILKKLDFLHKGENRLVLNYTHMTKKKNKKAMEGYIQKTFVLHIF